MGVRTQVLLQDNPTCVYTYPLTRKQLYVRMSVYTGPLTTQPRVCLQRTNCNTTPYVCVYTGPLTAQPICACV